jgi:lipoprotein-anchoring transpeptidase ErfK/SrfK
VAATNIAAPVPPTNAWRETLEAQVALARNGISPGSLDGLMGPQTAAAVRAFQRQQGLPASGALDTATRARLATGEPVTTNYVVTSADLARLQPLGTSWFAKSQQERLDFETVLELVAERFQAHPNLLRRLNPDQDWSRLAAGATVEVPHVSPPTVPNRAASLRILLADRVLQAFDERTNLLAHFPCSIGRLAEKRPVGELKVTVLAPDPNYTFDPEVFPESAEGRELGRKLLLQPGPNNPVGTVWIGLDRPGYGIHGTPQPEQVGRTESHGCFRLANWNAELLLKLAWVGLPVFVEP